MRPTLVLQNFGVLTPFLRTVGNVGNVFHGRGISDFEICPLYRKTFILTI